MTYRHESPIVEYILITALFIWNTWFFTSLDLTLPLCYKREAKRDLFAFHLRLWMFDLVKLVKWWDKHTLNDFKQWWCKSDCPFPIWCFFSHYEVTVTHSDTRTTVYYGAKLNVKVDTVGKYKECWMQSFKAGLWTHFSTEHVPGLFIWLHQ